MSLLKSIARKLPAQPFVITMSIVAGSIHTTITRADDPVPSNDFLALKGLPELVVQYLQAQTEIETGIYHLPFPSAKRLIRELHISELAGTVIVKAPGVEALKPVPVPDDFHVHWYFDSKRHVLMRRLVNADGYVGGGCFYQGTRIWRLEDKFSPQMLTWLGKAEIKGDQLALFMEQGLNAYPCKYFECDLVVEQGFNVLLKIVQLLELSMDVKLVTNLRDLQPGLQAINDSPNDLFSGHILLPGWGRLLRGQMLDLARSQKVMWLAGEALVDFIYNHGAHFAELGVSEAELTRIHTTYSIYDGATLPLAWKITHHSVEGIGRYWATPSLSSEDVFFPIDAIGAKLEAGAQFYAMGNHWIAFTPAFRTRYATWKTKKLRPISLLPQEVLGTQLDRLKQLKLVPPSINANTHASEEREQALEFFDAMRRQGLPAGIYGLQNEISDILAHVCSHLLQDNPQARILWIMPRRRLEAATATLGHVGIPIAPTSDDLEGHVTLLSPDVVPSLNINWTLIIFSNLDLIASGDAQSRLYASLSRKWAIGTFFHPTWAEDHVQAGNLLRVLRLGAEDLAAFQRYCLRTFSTQSDEISARLTSPFKKVTIGEESAGNTAAVPIPKPQQPSSPEVREVFRPSFAQTWASESTDTSFLASAQRYAQQTASPAEFVPFKQYFPTYHAMTSAQGRWYFYWRDEVRKGNYLDTDLSYLYLHVYEAINLVGFENALTAFEHLTAVWQHYRIAYPQFDNYLVDWLADFLIVYKLPYAPLEWYARAFEAGCVEMDMNRALEGWLTTAHRENIASIPEALLDKLCDYDYRKSKFFSQNHTTEYSLESQYRDALRLIDNYLYEQTGKSMLDFFHPADVMEIRHQPFMGAIYEGSRDEILVATVPDWRQAKELRDSITSIVKYTENRLRRQRNFKGTIRDSTLFAAWSAILDEAFPVSSIPQRTSVRRRKSSYVTGETLPSVEHSVPDAEELTIDFQQVDDLLASAQAIQGLLTVEETVDEMVEDTTEAVASEPIIVFDTERPSDTPPYLLTDLQEVAQVLSGDVHAVALLRFLREQNWTAQEKTVQRIIPDEFLSEILYRVNMRALDVLGDKLIFIDGDQITVTEDYQDEVEHLLTHMLSSAYSGQDDHVSVSEPQVTLIQDIDQLTPEWAVFVQRLQPQHWEILNVLLTGQNIMPQLETIARNADSMVSLLINEINTNALSSIGDIVIDSTVEPPILEEEDIDDLRVLNTWVLEHRIQES